MTDYCSLSILICLKSRYYKLQIFPLVGWSKGQASQNHMSLRPWVQLSKMLYPMSFMRVNIILSMKLFLIKEKKTPLVWDPIHFQVSLWISLSQNSFVIRTFFYCLMWFGGIFCNPLALLSWFLISLCFIFLWSLFPIKDYISMQLVCLLLSTSFKGSIVSVGSKEALWQG